MQATYCPNCGNHVKEGSKFCNKCGAMLNKRKDSTNNITSQSNGDFDNPEGTVLLGGTGQKLQTGITLKKATLALSLEDMLRGCTKVIDFGTGKKYELDIPAGLSPGDVIEVKDTGITDNDTGADCNIELTICIQQ